MFYTLSHCFGYVVNPPSPSQQHEASSIVTEEVEDEWTLVKCCHLTPDKDLDVDIDYPPPPPSPPVETTWLITPPPCFNAEIRLPVEELSPMENLLIEHPSIFFRSPVTHTEPKVKNLNQQSVSEEEKAVVTLQHKGKKLAKCSKRKRRVRQRQTVAVISVRKRHCKSEFKKRCWEVSKRSNAEVKKMRRIIQQPRKHC